MEGIGGRQTAAYPLQHRATPINEYGQEGQFIDGKVGSQMVPALIDGDKLRSQSNRFMSFMRKEWQLDGNAIGVDFRTMWAQTLSARHRYSDMSEYLKLAQIMLMCSAGSVENERLFSCMNLVKSKTRNALKSEHLNACLRLATSAHTFDTFPYKRAYEKFAGKKKRRPAYVRRKAAEQDVVVDYT